MDPIQEAIEGIESREDDASLSYLEVAKKTWVNRSTLSRRQQGKQRPNATYHQDQMLLNPQ
jgi:DNA invertase Pin-like site-specific DNA recombinase